MNYLEKVKTIVSMDKLSRVTKNSMASHYIYLAKTALEEEWNIDLSIPESTFPKTLFGKTYREMSKEEVAEYSQIKRVIRRSLGGKS